MKTRGKRVIVLETEAEKNIVGWEISDTETWKLTRIAKDVFLKFKKVFSHLSAILHTQLYDVVFLDSWLTKQMSSSSSLTFFSAVDRWPTKAIRLCPPCYLKKKTYVDLRQFKYSSPREFWETIEGKQICVEIREGTNIAEDAILKFKKLFIS